LPQPTTGNRTCRQLAALQQAKQDAPDRLQRLAELDARLTTALLAFGRDVAAGRTTPTRLTRGGRRAASCRISPDACHAAGGDLKAWIDAVRPPHPEYAALQQALINLRRSAAKGAGRSCRQRCSRQAEFESVGRHAAATTDSERPT